MCIVIGLITNRPLALASVWPHADITFSVIASIKRTCPAVGMAVIFSRHHHPLVVISCLREAIMNAIPDQP
jgi:xanthine/uracil/vitamin C permease (AzgA family)